MPVYVPVSVPLVQVPVTGDASWVAAAKLAGYAVGDLNGDGRLDLVKPDSSTYYAT